MGLFSGAILSMLQKTKSIGLKKKVLLLYGGVVVVPILIVGLVAENMILNSLRADYATSVSETALQLGKNVEFRKQSYELLAIRTATDGELIERLSKKYTDMITQWDTIHYLDKSFGLICNYLPGISSFRIYNINDSLVEDTHFLWKPDTNRKYAGINEKDWFDSLSSDPIAMKWTAIKDKYGRMDLILTRQITLSLGESIGIISFRINGSQVFGDLTSNAFKGVGRIYLINNDIVIASTPNEAVGKVVSQTELNNISFSDTPIEAVINQTKVMVVTEQGSPG